MSVYAKARALALTFMLSIPILSLLTLLALPTKSLLVLVPGLLALIVPSIAMLVAQKWPSCPSCGEKVLQNNIVRSGVALSMPRPECGFCGHDLSLSAGPE